MRKGAAAGPDNQGFIFFLLHELGHAFGLGDTYVRGRVQSTGGLAHTAGKQPISVMAGSSWRVRFPRNLPFHLVEDDKYGIIYLYKYLYEDHPSGDCFFPDYIRVERDGICRPKYPLIFEAKHGAFETVQQILIDDPTLDLNARDSQGMTAMLHYAGISEDSQGMCRDGGNTAGTSGYQGQPSQRAQAHPRTTRTRVTPDPSCQVD